MKVKTIDKHWNQNYLTIRLQHKIPSSNKPKAENKIISKSQTAPLPPVQQSIRHYPVYRSGSQVTISRLQSRQRQDGRIALNRLPAQRRNLRYLGTSQGEAWAARPVLRANVITPSNEIIHRPMRSYTSWLLCTAEGNWEQGTTRDPPLSASNIIDLPVPLHESSSPNPQ